MAIGKYVGLSEYQKIQKLLCDLNIRHDASWKYNLKGEMVYILRITDVHIIALIGQKELQFINGSLVDVVDIKEGI